MNKQYADFFPNLQSALIVQAACYADHDHKFEALRVIPGLSSGPFGLTPDHVKATPEYQKAYSEERKAFSAMQSINVVLNSKFKSEYRAYKIAQREAKLKGIA